MSKELYITWNINHKTDKNMLTVAEIDTDTGEQRVIFTTNEPIGIRNITEMMKKDGE